MLVSEKRLAANRSNSAQSTGPKSETGKAASRRNSLKHGLTGAGVVLTDGDPTDDWEHSVEVFRQNGAATIIACGAGPEVNDETLKRLGDKVVRLKDTQPGTLGAFMKWVSASVAQANMSLGTQAKMEDRFAPVAEDGGLTLIQ